MRVLLVTLLVTMVVSALATVPAAPAALAGLVAPRSACPDQTDPDAHVGLKVKAMHCMTNYARAQRGKPALERVPVLDRAARRKSTDVLRCDQFDHEACGRPFTYWMERLGYLDGACASAGENIAWGTGPLAPVRNIFIAWIRSPDHRANILGSFDDLGIGLRSGNLEGNPRAHVWTQDFGSRRC